MKKRKSLVGCPKKRERKKEFLFYKLIIKRKVSHKNRHKRDQFNSFETR